MILLVGSCSFISICMRDLYKAFDRMVIVIIHVFLLRIFFIRSGLSIVKTAFSEHLN